jgi:hypothetical protein
LDLRIDSYHRPVTLPLRMARGYQSVRIAAHAAKRRTVMGKYLIGWILGVPLFVLVIIYIFVH